MGKYLDAVQAILKRHYMDNYLDSFESSVKARAQIQDIFNIHADGGFQMCSWLTNDSGLMNWIPATLRTDSDKSLDFDLGLPQERILGLKWDPNSDSLSFNLKFQSVDSEVMNMDRSQTKREFLRILMSIFDPLGMVCHLTVRGKFLLQEIWRADIMWDEGIPDELLPQWRDFRRIWEEIRKISIPRCYCYRSTSIKRTDLHLFCDASERGYAAVEYFRFVTGDGMKTTTTTFWTDSQIVLMWLRADARKFQTFVANRVGEIEEQSTTDQWKWVPTELNTADVATRDGHMDNVL
ncbi:unnamed protein product, partial [Allacma fusca]